MPRPFDGLGEVLLQAGVAPRHVRRYVAELEEHFADLIAMQNERGYDGEDALQRARALIGSDDELADAMIAQRQFRSLAARAPWLVFGLVPPILVFALLAGGGLSMLAVWAMLPGYHPAPPDWLRTLAANWGLAANLTAGPLTAVFLVVVARKQRLAGLWPRVAVGLAALVSAFTVFTVRLPGAGKLGEIGVGLGANDATLWQNAGRFGLTLAVVAAAAAVLRRRTLV